MRDMSCRDAPKEHHSQPLTLISYVKPKSSRFWIPSANTGRNVKLGSSGYVEKHHLLDQCTDMSVVTARLIGAGKPCISNSSLLASDSDAYVGFTGLLGPATAPACSSYGGGAPGGGVLNLALPSICALAFRGAYDLDYVVQESGILI